MSGRSEESPSGVRTDNVGFCRQTPSLRKTWVFRTLPSGSAARTHARSLARTPKALTANASGDLLGEPMSIREVARMLGCSEWTVRQQYLPRGIPHFRLSPAGRLLFFHNQIVRWVLEIQRQKGGIIR